VGGELQGGILVRAGWAGQGPEELGRLPVRSSWWPPGRVPATEEEGSYTRYLPVHNRSTQSAERPQTRPTSSHRHDQDPRIHPKARSPLGARHSPHPGRHHQLPCRPLVRVIYGRSSLPHSPNQRKVERGRRGCGYPSLGGPVDRTILYSQSSGPGSTALEVAATRPCSCPPPTELQATSAGPAATSPDVCPRRERTSRRTSQTDHQARMRARCGRGREAQPGWDAPQPTPRQGARRHRHG
jgi:hypothetical protein